LTTAIAWAVIKTGIVAAGNADFSVKPIYSGVVSVAKIATFTPLHTLPNRNTMKLTLLSALTVALFTLHFNTRAQAVNTQDSLALVDLYNNTGGPNWQANTNWLTTAPVGEWFGIKVSGGRVKYINLAGDSLKGSLPPTIGNLSAADTILLSLNNLGDSIPSAITGLKPVVYLDISNNNFTFAGMEAIHSNLILAKYSPQNNIAFTINGNLFSFNAGGTLGNDTFTWYKNSAQYATKTGDSTLTVPLAEVDNEYALTITNSHVPGLTLYSPYPLRVQDSLALVDFADSTGQVWAKYRGWGKGPIQNWGGIALTKGRVASVNESGVNMAGNIPASFGNLTALETLDLSNNFLSSVPATIGNLQKLRYINLYHNQAIDTIPVEIGRLAALTYVNFSVANLRHFQDSLLRLTQLQTLDLSYNKISGTIPDAIGNLLNLQVVSFFGNNLSGTIPASLGNCTNLTSLNLNYNSLSGTIPASLGNCVNLTILYLGSNSLSGTIPASFSNLSHLKELRCYGDSLTGNLPNSLTRLKALTFIDVRNNMLSGSLPPLIDDTTKYVFIGLANNHFSGDVSSIILAGSHPNTNSMNLYVDNNGFTFRGMETLIQKFAFYSYAPQANIPIYRQGNVLYVAAGGTLANDTFRLFKDGELVQAHIGDSAFTISATGSYNITATNKIATQLTLYSDTLNVDALPVTLLNFTAARVKTNVQLNWQTVQEVNTASYGIERSTDGLGFKGIGTIAAAGNSTITRAYVFTDFDAAAVNSNTLYYRLKITDKDGSYSYSKIISLQNDGSSNAFIVYPNPARTSCIVQFTAHAAEKYSIALVAADGKVLKRISIAATAGINRAVIDIRNLPQATYLINITGKKDVTTLKLVKE